MNRLTARKQSVSVFDPDEEPLIEVVNGREVETPHMTALASWFASQLATSVALYGKEMNLGCAVVETLFRLRVAPEYSRRPDVAFVSYERWPKDKMEGLDQNTWPVTPDLAAEVVSKHDEVEALLEKLEEYFAAGVRQVWVMVPKKALIYVYDSFTRVRILTRDDVLEGGAVLPGFSLVLKEFFPETLAQLNTPRENDE